MVAGRGRRVRRLLVANRGEISRRVQRTAREMGIDTVAVFVDADRAMPFVREADRTVRVPSYLDGAAIVDAARRTAADALHPGYGFLSESAGFAQQCLDAGLTFIGPRPDAMRAMASKIEAKRIAQAAGVPVLPWGEATNETASALGYPLLVKAAAGGGGRGMRRVESSAELAESIASARREAGAAFGDDRVFLERCWDGARHVEVQVLGDCWGNLVHLFERECSIQRRHQKVIEEAPASCLAPEVRERLFAAALALARAIDYTNAGTVEFLVQGGEIAMLEMNTRLQVEHPVTEAITGLDLVRLQLEVASETRLPFSQDEIVAHGSAVEARLYAEDPAHNFLPSIGRLARFVVDGARWDGGVESGSEIGPEFDGLLAKAIAHAATREEATARLARALRGAQVHGVASNRDALVAILDSDAFAAGDLSTDFLDEHPELLQAHAPDDVVQVHALAAKLYARARSQAARRVWRFVPPGWRNLPTTESEPDTAVIATGDDWVDLEVDGVQARFDVHDVDGAHYVNGLGWQTRHARAPRFGSSDAEGSATEPTSPLPGTVVAVLVSRGDRVQAGQSLVVLDAMKIEHHIVAEADAEVVEVRVQPGQRVDAHQVLVVLGP